MKKIQHKAPTYQNIAAILLVGGYSSRMQTLKALLPFHKKESLLTHSISILHTAGIKHIYIILGFEHERIESHIKVWEKKNKEHEKLCKIIFNPRFDEGMFTSVCAGFNAILQDNEKHNRKIDASFLLPVDAALLHTKTINTMLEHTQIKFKQNTELVQEKPHPLQKHSILIPTFLNKCGHPPLITKAHFAPILNYEKTVKENINGEKFRGLQGYLANLLPHELKKSFLKGLAPTSKTYIQYVSQAHNIEFLPFADEGVLCDIDTPEEYKKSMQFLALTENRKKLSLLESWHILTHNNLTERIIKHSYKVGIGAFRLYVKLQDKYSIHKKELLTCFCGGLLHDICRLEKHHAEVGAAFISSLGYKKVASIIKAHTNLPKKIIQELDSFIDYLPTQESHNLIEDLKMNTFKIHNSYLPILCVHLADKFYAGDTFIGMKKRFELINERFAEDEIALKAIQERQEIAKKTAFWFFSETNSIAEECVETPTNHAFERIIMEQYNLLP